MKELDAIKLIAKSKATANRVAKAIDLVQLKQAIAHLQEALKTAQTREATKDSKRRAANIKKLTSLMAEMGLSPQDITKNALKTPAKKSTKKSKASMKSTTKKSKVGPKKGRKVAPKYKITSEGKTHKWTGRGRMPIVFKNFVENGGTLDQCLI
jgi:DNA-binding protein H-NS